jgi:hypothetical protein
MNSRLIQGEKKERWQELCEQATKEQDPQKLLNWYKRLTNCLPSSRRGLTRPSRFLFA